MAYKILRPDGTVLLNLADNTIDQSATSLTLVGKNYSGYGEIWNTNLVRLLSNSASITARPPRSPLAGQLWYDTTVKRLKVYDGGFKTVNGVPFSATLPVTVINGDLWYDTTTEQLKLHKGTESVVIGPAYPATAGENSWIIPPDDSTVNDAATDTPQDVLVLKSYDASLAIANGGDLFETTISTKNAYLPNAYPTSEVVKGITIANDLRVYGQMSNHGMTASFNVDEIAEDADIENPVQIDSQNAIISSILDKMFPPNAKTTGAYQHPGMPLGSVARVAIWTNNSSKPPSDPDYDEPQVRLFRTVGTIGSTYWTAWPIFTLKNIID